MKLLIPHVMSSDHAEELSEGAHQRDFFEPLIEPITQKVSEHVEVDFSHPSYCEVQHYPTGHGWHKDTGNFNHMDWCGYTASVLLTPPEDFAGGKFYFEDEDEPIINYLDLLIYSSDVVHRVTPHGGNRRVLLLFMKGR